jgi:OOP family OmpA-OmpF porin
MFKLAYQGIAAIILTVGISAPIHALDFYFDGYGGFTDPDMVNPPPTPADGADTNSTVDFPQPFKFENPSGFDPDINAFGSFQWDINLSTHSHLTINELDPDLIPPSGFEDPVQDSTTVDDPNGSVVGWLIHHNESITTGFGPDNLAVHYHVDIYEDVARTGLLFQSGPMDFTLDVMETHNNGDLVNGLCLDNDSGLTGSDTGNSTPCPDRFRVTSGWSVNPVAGGEPFESEIGTFTHMGNRYRVVMSGFWDNGNLISEAWSAEGTHNQFDIHVRVETDGPSSIMFKGDGGSGSTGPMELLLGLLALPLLARRRGQRRNVIMLGCILLLVAAVLLAGTANADENPWYAGAGVGLADIDVDDDDYDRDLAQRGYTTSSSLDDTATGWKLFGGYRFTRNWAVEAAYVDLGDVTSETTVKDGPPGFTAQDFVDTAVKVHPYSVDGFTLSGVGTWPVNKKFSLFAKLGIFKWDADIKVECVGCGFPVKAPDDESGTDWTAGAGAGYDFNDEFGMRLEFERYATDRDDVNFFSVSGLFRL